MWVFIDHLDYDILLSSYVICIPIVLINLVFYRIFKFISAQNQLSIRFGTALKHKRILEVRKSTKTQQIRIYNLLYLVLHRKHIKFHKN